MSAKPSAKSVETLLTDDRVLRVLMIGDVVGSAGVRALYLSLKQLRKRYNSDLVIANVENSAEGFGLTCSQADELVSCGIDVMTSGNHIWERREIWASLESDDRLLRPHNYPSSLPGKGVCIVETKGVTVGVLNLQGRLGMMALDCPFSTAQSEVSKLRKITPLIFVDMHAESTEEKEALSLYLDGQVSCVVGTHTHVQTADERICPSGTGYLTDLGMTGPHDSVLGMDIETVISRSLSQMPLKMVVADGPADICGALISVDKSTGNTIAIERIHERSEL